MAEKFRKGYSGNMIGDNGAWIKNSSMCTFREPYVEYPSGHDYPGTIFERDVNIGKMSEDQCIQKLSEYHSHPPFNIEQLKQSIKTTPVANNTGAWDNNTNLCYTTRRGWFDIPMLHLIDDKKVTLDECEQNVTNENKYNNDNNLCVRACDDMFKTCAKKCNNKLQEETRSIEGFGMPDTYDMLYLTLFVTILIILYFTFATGRNTFFTF